MAHRQQRVNPIHIILRCLAPSWVHLQDPFPEESSSFYYATMAFRRQHPHDSYRGQLTDHERRARLGIPNNGPDPVMYALATNLPMSRFPDDGVHSRARYGTAEPHLYPFAGTRPVNGDGNCFHGYGQSYIIRDLAVQGLDTVTTPELEGNSILSAFNTDYVRYHSANATFPYAHDQFFHDCAVGPGDVRDAVPPLSASTASLDGSSSWSMSESAPEIGAMPIDVGDSFLLDRTYQNVVPCDFIGEGAHLVPHDLPEYDRNNWLRYSSSAAPVQSLATLDIHKLGLDTSSTYPIEVFHGDNSNLTSAFQVLTDPAVYLPWTSESHTPQPVFLSADNDNANDPEIDREINDFLDELGTSINWDNIEPCLEDHNTIGQTNTLSPHLEMEIDVPSIFEHDHHQSSRDLPDYVDSPDDWSNEFLGEGTAFTDLANVLDEHEEATAAAFLGTTDDWTELRT